MAQFLRPISDVSFLMLGGYPTNTAGNRYQNIDEETPSDTDYIYTQNNPGGASLSEFGFSSPSSTPIGDTGHVLRIRTAQIDEDSGAHPRPSNTSGTATSFSWSLRQGTTEIEGGTINPADWTTVTINLSEVNVANITNYADLNIDINASGGGGSPANRRAVAISWIELEVPNGEIPIEGNKTLDKLTINTSQYSLTALAEQSAEIVLDKLDLILGVKNLKVKPGNIFYNLDERDKKRNKMIIRTKIIL